VVAIRDDDITIKQQYTHICQLSTRKSTVAYEIVWYIPHQPVQVVASRDDRTDRRSEVLGCRRHVKAICRQNYQTRKVDRDEKCYLHSHFFAQKKCKYEFLGVLDKFSLNGLGIFSFF
jgi:hypothetical protein